MFHATPSIAELLDGLHISSLLSKRSLKVSSSNLPRFFMNFHGHFHRRLMRNDFVSLNARFCSPNRQLYLNQVYQVTSFFSFQ